MSAGDRDSLSPGAADMCDRFVTDFRHTLFDRPDVRKRWVLRHRNKESVAEIAGELAWSVAISLDSIDSTGHLGRTVRAAAYAATSRCGRRRRRFGTSRRRGARLLGQGLHDRRRNRAPVTCGTYRTTSACNRSWTSESVAGNPQAEAQQLPHGGDFVGIRPEVLGDLGHETELSHSV
ncbi:hypothetical protein JHN53_11125 [Streptomyces sp. MBT58]|uniref:hypothetical protein n=1 Tax=Streptomyces sp. MBT58 TaxID=1488389 RepID=UPI0019149F4E|nr:hypothetical protein [Streptomyces sp. MBT58]MBK5992184.1 hypothetical protein [Streptomyces sp. MBT58]